MHLTDTSIVIPARNESSRLPGVADQIRALATAGAEVIIAADITSDDDTHSVAEAIAASTTGITVATVDQAGKGNAVRTGIAATTRGVVLIADADFSVDSSGFEALVLPVRSSGAVGIASRNLRNSQRLDEPVARRIVSRLFNLAVRATVLRGLSDTQCGFKAFPGDAVRRVIGEVKTAGWAFDVELLALLKARGIPIVEVPVVWRYKHGSTVRVVAHAIDVARELRDIRARTRL